MAEKPKSKSTKMISPYFGLSKRPGAGRRSYEPSHIYRYLFDNTDQNGVLLYTLNELARVAKVDYHTFSYLISDFEEVGLVEKMDRQFKFKVHPSQIEWNDELYEQLDELKKRHFSSYKKKENK